MTGISERDDYYTLEEAFQKQTAKYLDELRILENVLRNRTKEYPVNLRRRVRLIISVLESELIKIGNR